MFLNVQVTRETSPASDELLVAIWVSFVGAGIQDSFVIHQLVAFVLCKGKQFIGVRIPYDVVRVKHLDLAWFWKGVLDFVEDILTHDVIVQLGVSFAVETEASDLAFDLLVIRSIAIILGSSADEFFDVFLIL